VRGETASPFSTFLHFTDWLYAQVCRTDSIALARLAELLFSFLTEEVALDAKLVAETLWRAWQRGGRCDKPEFLRSLLPEEQAKAMRSNRALVPKRQDRHIARA
jgi:hypothetical protein